MVKRKFKVTILATKTGVEANAFLNQEADNWDEIYSYFHIVAMDLGATTVPPQPKLPKTLVVDTGSYEITLSTN